MGETIFFRRTIFQERKRHQQRALALDYLQVRCEQLHWYDQAVRMFAMQGKQPVRGYSRLLQPYRGAAQGENLHNAQLHLGAWKFLPLCLFLVGRLPPAPPPLPLVFVFALLPPPLV